ncbi:unnamed protein product [Chilo suppressalis]|uniref:Sodium-dependent dopamine transporter n=1 Tax=Chilo suppressalis TaxID=168631 RepID=A0ABN8B3V9_CHISP|nr:hypothetical protein evm_008656 [Chilo suppressalis]CAH0402143.1 unnamed protein product [Chilo suppressalis]
MPYHQATIDNNSSSSLSSVKNSKFYIIDHFKWKSIKKFIYIAHAVSFSASNYDIFSRIYENVRILDFLICEITIGMTYMCMDCFIKQYTRKIDFNSTLNPLLKGITYGILLQSALWTLLHSSDLADSVCFLAASLKSSPSWSKCQKTDLNMSCVSSRDVLLRCSNKDFTSFNNTSAHINYLKSFMHQDKYIITTRFFVTALVWIFNFFYSTVPDETLIKILKLTFLWRFYSTITVLVLIIFAFSNIKSLSAIANIFEVNTPTSFTASMDHIAYAFNIGLIGVYDFGTMSPYTMIDNAVVIFTVIFTISAFARSVIVKILYTAMTTCVKVNISITPHNLLFAVLPLSTDFFYAHKLYVIYIYLNTLLGAEASLATLTLTMSKLIHSEFRSVKNIYIVGVLCFIGFSFSVPVTSLLSYHKMQGVIYGLNVTVLYLGGFKVAIVMWIYGVQRFSTDIRFWLGFNPTKFWRICWSFMPVVLFTCFGTRVYILTQMRDLTMVASAAAWISLSLLTVLIIQLRTASQYIVSGNLANVLSCSKKYGPPDPVYRKRRRNFTETLRIRRCAHSCKVIDDMLDCNHLPITSKYTTGLYSESSSMQKIYEAGTSKQPIATIESQHSGNYRQ